MNITNYRGFLTYRYKINKLTAWERLEGAKEEVRQYVFGYVIHKQIEV